VQQCSGALAFENYKYSGNVDTEVELISAESCDQDVAFCRKLADELGFKQTKPSILWEDNNGCLSLAKSGHYKGRRKHFEIRFRFISDYIDP
jgi:hypothetical protein